MKIEKLNYLRSPRHRRFVASLPCVSCGVEGMTQAAHTNFGKGLAMKACDSQLMALCCSCHTKHDSGAIYGDKFSRWKTEAELVDATRAELIARNQWLPEVEEAYKRAFPRLRAAAESDLTVAATETADVKKAAVQAASFVNT